MNFWKKLDENFEEYILMVFLVVMAIVMMWQVIMRYFFHASMPWPEEFCRFMFVFSGFLSMGYCVRKDKMLKVDILMGFFPEWLKNILDIVSRFVTLFFFAYLCYWGLKTAQSQVQMGMKSAAMGWPMWVIYGSVFVGALIGTLRQIQDLYRHFTKKKEDAE